MLPPIPSEGSYVSWLANCLQRYFEALGFSFYHEIQSQPLEKNYPFDIYASIERGNFVKRFGLQVKRPYSSKRGIYWKLDSTQHARIEKFNWIWYSLPDFLSRQYHQVACFHIVFKNPRFHYVPSLHKSTIGFYLRLGSFADSIKNCAIGQEMNKNTEWTKSEDIFQEYHFVNQIHTYLDFTDKKARLFTKVEEKQDQSE